MNELFIIGNEKISKNGKKFFSANIDFKTIIEGLTINFNLNVLARGSNNKQTFNIVHKNIILSTNILIYLINTILTFRIKKSIYLIISITPYTFLSFLILSIFKKNIFLYLRSDGYKEYEAILGKKWVFLYRIMFLFMTKNVKIISCHKSLSRGKPFFFVKPSELSDLWLTSRTKNIPKINVNLLYVGRIRVEKGIFSLLDIFNQLDDRFNLTIIGDREINTRNYKNLSFFYFFNSIRDLIFQYDKCHIFVLPSYTEAHPKVIDEALSRLKPVIIFDDIAHVIENRIGVFKTKRNVQDFIDLVENIKKNYNEIVRKIYSNNLPTKKKFIQDLTKIIK